MGNELQTVAVTEERMYPESAVEQLRAVLRKAWGLAIEVHCFGKPDGIAQAYNDFMVAYYEIPGTGPFESADEFYDAVVKGNESQ